MTAASDRWLLNRNKDLGLGLYVETDDGKRQGSASDLPLGPPRKLLAADVQLSPHLAPEGWPFSVKGTQWVEGRGFLSVG